MRSAGDPRTMPRSRGRWCRTSELATTLPSLWPSTAMSSSGMSNSLVSASMKASASLTMSWNESA